jgi:hypothetical protein
VDPGEGTTVINTGAVPRYSLCPPEPFSSNFELSFIEEHIVVNLKEHYVLLIFISEVRFSASKRAP